MLYVLLFILQDDKCYAINIITQSSNLNTISDILLCGSISMHYFLFWVKKTFRCKGLNFSWSPCKSNSVQQINNVVCDDMLISICHMNMDIFMFYISSLMSRWIQCIGVRPDRNTTFWVDHGTKAWNWYFYNTDII